MAVDSGCGLGLNSGQQNARCLRSQRPGAAMKRAVLLNLWSAAELAHHEADKFFNGHFLAIEFHLVVGVMQFGDDIVALQLGQLRTDAMLLNMSAVAVA